MRDVADVVGKQRAYFRGGNTRDPRFRIDRLRALRRVLEAGEKDIVEAVAADMRKPAFETITSEWSLVITEIKHAVKNLPTWVRPRRVRTAMLSQPGSSTILRVPYGVALIMSPWNYPFLLSLQPLVGAVAAGNCVVVKPSEYSPNSSSLIARLIGEAFDDGHITTVLGGVDRARALLEQRFDYILFSGGARTGRLVMEAASRDLTPLTLELGGKCPCIVEPDVDPVLAARRIAWGKFYNAGQSCMAPDYALVSTRIKDRFLEAMAQAVQKFYRGKPAESRDYGRIVNEAHFDRLASLLNEGRIVVGGQMDRSDLYIAPTVLDDVGLDDPVMAEEIFGPILPVLTYDAVSEAISIVGRHPQPLGLYIFSNSPAVQRELMDQIPSGGVCLNDVMFQIIGPHLPLGGIGESGMGCYHGRTSFETFTHQRSIFRMPVLIDVPLRYPPYKGKERFVRRLT